MSHAVVKWVDNEANMEKLRPAVPNGFDIAAWKRQIAWLIENDSQNGSGKLQNCTAQSLWLGVIKAAELGLRFDRDECYLVPYGKYADFQESYKGLITLCKRSGRIEHVKADVVREGDEIDYGRAPHAYFEHRPLPFNEGEIVGSYALFYFTDGRVEFEVLSRADVDAIRSMAANGSMMWNSFWGEGAKKAAIRRGIKVLELVPEDQRAILELARREFDFQGMADTARQLQQALASPALPAPSQAVEEAPSESAPPADDDGADSTQPSAMQSLAQLLRHTDITDDEKDAAKEKFAGFDESNQSDWLTIIREAEGDDRARIARELGSV